jgi:glycosyltransferase involved in cell wall biosynthesis
MKDDRRSGQKLTVAHCMPWSGMGGVEIATLRMVEATRRQFRHIAFCLSDAVALRDAFERLGIKTVTYNLPEPSLRHGGRYYKESKIVARQLKQVEADIVHFEDVKAAYHNSLAAMIARTRIVCHIRSANPRLDLRQKLCLLPVHQFIFVSKESRQSFAMSLPDSKTHVIYDAVEVPTENSSDSAAAVRRELGVPHGCVLVGMVARVAPVKDYFTLADAAVQVLARHPDTRFLIVGDNSLEELNRNHYDEVLNKLNKLGIADSFIFTGHRDDVPRLIAAMDQFVLSTHREGFPLSILEAMAMGKPVVATAVGGIPEIVTQGVTGYLHQHGNSQELADALLRLMDNPEEARRMGASAREHVLQNYSRQKFTDEIAKTYLDVMRG